MDRIICRIDAERTPDNRYLRAGLQPLRTIFTRLITAAAARLNRVLPSGYLQRGYGLYAIGIS
ncbi:hypothetical protein D3C78_1753290 [compost metagenome]